MKADLTFPRFLNTIDAASVEIRLRCRVLLSIIAIALATLTVIVPANAAPLTVPNGSFSDPANNGALGGGFIGGSGSAMIGSGPWQGTYNGVIGVLAPPTLQIHGGGATISGLAGINVLGIANNAGYFSQELSSTFAPQRHYVLAADIDTGVPLNVGLLNTGNAGLALTSAGSPLATTSNAASGIVSLALLDGTTYHLTLTYDTGASASGNIGVRAFATPQNLVTANLINSVTFHNVTLSSSAINPVAASIGSAGGTPQGATVDAAFATAFVVAVLDAEGDPVPNATVTFAAPSSGPSATLSATTIVTDANGQAHVTGVANGIAGAYTITATVDGVGTPAVFQLTNLAGTASSVAAASGTPQNATVATAFSTPLGVTVLDADNNPVSGITVRFAAPGSGASVTFPSGSTANTDSSGHAQVDVVANTVAGDYNVTASVNGAGTAASFVLTNLAGAAYLAVPASGTPQSAMVSTPFDSALAVIITDAYGNPVSGASVTFTVQPNADTGAGASFPPGQATLMVITDREGHAQVQADANEFAGSYQITASGNGLATVAVFNLTNTADVTPIGTPTSGGGQGANVEAAFSCMLQLKVTSDGSTPMVGVSIDFVAPNSGPSAMLSNGIDSGTTVTQTTDINGMVAVTAQANDIAGKYTISAGVTGSGSALADYPLSNFPAGERIFQGGFEILPSRCSGN